MRNLYDKKDKFQVSGTLYQESSIENILYQVLKIILNVLSKYMKQWLIILQKEYM